MEESIYQLLIFITLQTFVETGTAEVQVFRLHRDFTSMSYMTRVIRYYSPSLCRHECKTLIKLVTNHPIDQLIKNLSNSKNCLKKKPMKLINWKSNMSKSRVISVREFVIDVLRKTIYSVQQLFLSLHIVKICLSVRYN